jgi:hypothetical protein
MSSMSKLENDLKNTTRQSIESSSDDEYGDNFKRDFGLNP